MKTKMLGVCRLVVSGVVCAVLIGCGGDGGGDGAATTEAVTTLGADGGTVNGPDGTSIVVPADALAYEVTLRIAKDATGAPDPVAGLDTELAARVSSTYAFTPHGVHFDEPVTIRLPFDDSEVGADDQLVILKGQPGGTWEIYLNARREDGYVETEVSDFSFFYVATLRVPPAQTIVQPFGIHLVALGVDGTDPQREVRYEVTGRPPTCAGGGRFVTSVFNVTDYTDTTDQGFRQAAGWVEIIKRQSGTFAVPSATVAASPNRFNGTFLQTAHYARLMFSGYAGAAGAVVVEIGTVEVNGSYTCVLSAGGEVTLNSGETVGYPPFEPGGVAMLSDTLGPTTMLLPGERPNASVTMLVPYVERTAEVGVYWDKSTDQGTSWQQIGFMPFTDSTVDTSSPIAFPPRIYTFELPAVTAADDGALVRARYCTTPSSIECSPSMTRLIAGTAYTLEVVDGAAAPSFTQMPRSVLVLASETASFSVVVAGAPEPTLQWQIREPEASDWQDIPGASQPNYTTAPLALSADGTQYRVIATNFLGNATSDAATLSVSETLVGPSVVGQPLDLSVTVGSDAVFAVIARGTEALSYQWYFEGEALQGENGPMLKLPAVTLLSEGEYQVEVSNALDSVRSDVATLTVTEAPLTVVDAPYIEVEPAAATANEGDTATFSVTATGDGLRYQWLRDGMAITNATSATYTTPTLILADDGTLFSVLVYNAEGQVFSEGALLTVDVVIGPAGMAIYAGDFSEGGGGGSMDGIGTAARFDFPEGILADDDGNLYVASSNGRRVSKIAPSTVVTTVFSAAVGTATNNFGYLALAPSGDLYTAGVSYCGLFLTTPPLSAGASAQELMLTGCPGSETRGIAVDANGVVHLSMRGANSIVRVGELDVDHYPVSILAGAMDVYVPPGSTDDTGTAARFSGPSGIAFDAGGDLFVCDTNNHTIRRVTPAGVVTTFAGLAGNPGLVDGNGTDARLYRPVAIDFDADGNMIVLQLGNVADPVAHVRHITPSGDVTTLFDATTESVALATPGGQEAVAANIKSLAVLGPRRIALSAGNAILVRTLP